VSAPPVSLSRPASQSLHQTRKSGEKSMPKQLATRRSRARVGSGCALRARVFKVQPLLLALSLIPLGAAAQSETVLEEMVVSASGFEQEIKDAPASISVITREELETRQYRDLAEALTNVEGVDVRGATG